MKIICKVSVLSIVLMVLVSQADAELHTFSMHHDSQNPLRGVAGIWVEVEDIAPVIELDGLHKEQIRKDVESKFQNAGFKILTEKEYEDAAGLSHLSIRINSMKTSAPAYYNYAIRVSLNQGLYIQRTVDVNALLSKTEMPVWVKDLTGSTVRAASIRNTINSSIDKLINNYMAAKLEMHK